MENEGMTPPNRVEDCDEMLSPRTSPSAERTAAAVSSQLVSMPRIRQKLPSCIVSLSVGEGVKDYKTISHLQMISL